MSSAKSGKDADNADEDSSVPPYTAMVPEFWLDRCHEFSKFHIMKYERIFQSLVYLTKFKERSDICFVDTNRLSWKKTAPFLCSDNQEVPDLFGCIGTYVPFGAKEDEYLEYQKLQFIKDNLAGINEEHVDEFSAVLGKLLRWINSTLQTRIDDVISRRAQKNGERESRKEAIEREQERQVTRTELLEEAKQQFEEAKEEAQAAAEEAAEGDGETAKTPVESENVSKVEVPTEFDQEAFDKKFDDENPPVDIPDEVLDFVDNDFNLEVEGEE